MKTTRILALVLLVLVTFAQVVFRYVLQTPLSWSEEVARFLLMWLAALSGAYAFKTRAHFALKFVTDRFSPRLQRIVATMVTLAVVLFLAIFAYQAFKFMLEVRTMEAPATIDLIGDENDQATIPDLSSQVAATDNISDAADLTITQTPVAGGTIELGDTPVTVMATDEAGNEAEVVVVVSVSPMNRPPQIDAGFAQSIRLPHKSVTLSGTATDDGLPEGGALTVEWTLASGPASVSFTDASSLGTKVTFTEAGTYVLLLTVTDGDLTVTDEVTITVTPKPRPLPPGNLHVRLIE